MVPHYILYDRYSGAWSAYQLLGERYQELEIVNDRLWLPALSLGLGLWQGEYEGITRQWLRWLGASGNWIATPPEQSEQQRDSAQERAARMAERLRALGVDPDEV
jgi:hypothetical protein